MAEIKITVQCEVDGAELPGFPLIFREVVTEAVPLEVQVAGNGGSYVQVPGTIPSTLQVLIMSFDELLNFQFNNGGVLPMSAAGCVVLVGSNIASGSATNVTVNNPNTNPANLVGVAAGS